MPSGLQKTYTKILVSLLRKDGDMKNNVEKIVTELKTVMSKRGHASLLPTVLRSALRQLESSSSSISARLTIAKAGGEKLHSGLTKETQIIIDPTIIGGYILTHEHKQTDNSYKTKLTTLYRKVTS